MFPSNRRPLSTFQNLHPPVVGFVVSSVSFLQINYVHQPNTIAEDSTYHIFDYFFYSGNGKNEYEGNEGGVASRWRYIGNLLEERDK